MEKTFNVDDALCATADPELFFADDEENYNETLVRQAKIICFQCPIRELCLERAMDDTVDGIWGGTTTAERRIFKERVSRGLDPYVKGSPITKKAQLRGRIANKKRATKAALKDKQILEQAITQFAHKADDLTKQIVELRINNLDKSLTEIGLMLNPPVSKDIVSGRIRRLKEWAKNG